MRRSVSLAELRSLLLRNSVVSKESVERIDRLSRAFQHSAAAASSLIRRLSAAAETSENIFAAMDFTFLFDESRELFSIGYRGSMIRS